MDHRVQSAISGSCGDRFVENDYGYLGIELAPECTLDLPPSLIADEITRLRSNGEILGHLRFQASILDSRLRALENAVAGTTGTLEAIRGAR